MKVVLLAHSHVGAGVYDALKDAGIKPSLAVGYTEPEDQIPAPNLVEEWRKRGISTVGCWGSGTRPALANYESFEAGDVLISANWRGRIPPEYYRQFPLAVNFHGSNTKYKRYRGRRPIQRQVEDGRKAYCLTCHKLGEEYDAGEIIVQSTRLCSHAPLEGWVYAVMRCMAYEMTTWLLENLEDVCPTLTTP